MKSFPQTLAAGAILFLIILLTLFEISYADNNEQSNAAVTSPSAPLTEIREPNADWLDGKKVLAFFDAVKTKLDFSGLVSLAGVALAAAALMLPAENSKLEQFKSEVGRHIIPIKEIEKLQKGEASFAEMERFFRKKIDSHPYSGCESKTEGEIARNNHVSLLDDVGKLERGMEYLVRSFKYCVYAILVHFVEHSLNLQQSSLAQYTVTQVLASITEPLLTLQGIVCLWKGISCIRGNDKTGLKQIADIPMNVWNGPSRLAARLQDYYERSKPSKVIAKSDNKQLPT